MIHVAVSTFMAAGLMISTAPVENQPPAQNKIAERVSYCESGKRNVRNRQGSSASGYFQFLDSTWERVTGLAPPAMDYSYETQLKAFKELWDEGRGSSHWNPSRSCWELEEPWRHYER